MRHINAHFVSYFVVALLSPVLQRCFTVLLVFLSPGLVCFLAHAVLLTRFSAIHFLLRVLSAAASRV